MTTVFPETRAENSAPKTHNEGWQGFNIQRCQPTNTTAKATTSFLSLKKKKKRSSGSKRANSEKKKRRSLLSREDIASAIAQHKQRLDGQLTSARTNDAVNALPIQKQECGGVRYDVVLFHHMRRLRAGDES